MPWKFHDSNLSKARIMFQHGKQVKPGWMTWNSHGIDVNFDQTAIKSSCDGKLAWHGISMRIHVTFFIGYEWMVYSWWKHQLNYLIITCLSNTIPIKMWQGFSWKYHVISRHKSTAVRSKSTPNSMTCSQILLVFHAGTWHGFWTSSSHGVSIAFA